MNIRIFWFMVRLVEFNGLSAMIALRIFSKKNISN